MVLLIPRLGLEPINEGETLSVNIYIYIYMSYSVTYRTSNRRDSRVAALSIYLLLNLP